MLTEHIQGSPTGTRGHPGGSPLRAPERAGRQVPNGGPVVIDANSVLGKVQRILEVFGPDDEALSLSELARRTGVPKASVHRLAQELVAWGIVERQGGDYRLGMRLFEIGQRVPRQRILRDVTRPFMEDLYRATNETIHLAVLDGLDVLYLEKVSGHGQISRPSRVAGRMPLHCTATGKALLAHASADRVEEVIARRLTRVTPRTTVAPRLLDLELQRIRQVGHAVEYEQTRTGYASVAIPLAGSTGVTVAALSITAPVMRVREDRFAQLLHGVSKQVTALLRVHDV